MGQERGEKALKSSIQTDRQEQDQHRSHQQMTIEFDPKSVRRAERAIRCGPFTPKLFCQLSFRGVGLSEITGNEGVSNAYTKKFMGLIPGETALLWLVNVGVLRREVDGQGITDSFRLTPMGFYITQQQWQDLEAYPEPSLGDRLQNFLAQWQPTRFI
ncbi:hypothetical protein Pse7367_1413 [Thalassoporum mexicanum PCC 7367]|uniref:Npun_F0494 family protein n=1 Tax=Thalassoporum mexicanum TaxID=3457544 RepID=UPI00029F88FF|nr:Npun_F0494 family protein [Pseudanabaena sp. PCC 7367]AFY69704.1 hypothetical protein Pse7367_1413 [Pseudanabaena sp. PCC 7367]